MNKLGNTRRYENWVRRDTLLAMLRAALMSGDLHFARQAALNWLAAYPGDLEVRLLEAQALLADGRQNQVVTAVDQICRADPFYLDCYLIIADACRTTDRERFSQTQTALYALGAVESGEGPLQAWGGPLRSALQALNENRCSEADGFVQEAVRLAPNSLLVGAVHLLVDRAEEENLAVHQLARMYHSRWPECVLFRLVLAETLLELGSEPEAVGLLHQCVAGDAAGQVARRLWGADHAYRSLWPDHDNGFVVSFDLPIPAGVAYRLGWNRLPSGEAQPAAAKPVQSEPQLNDTGSSIAASAIGVHAARIKPEAADRRPESRENTPAFAAKTISVIQLPPAENSVQAEAPQPSSSAEEVVELPGVKSQVELANQEVLTPETEVSPSDRQVSAAGLDPVRRPDASSPEAAASGETGSPREENTAARVEKTLDRIAKKTRQPAASRSDGRFPVYVIFSSKEGLVRQYGPRTTEVLDGELRRLAALIRQRKGWGAVVYYPDDTASASQCGLLPMDGSDPWKLKHALTELDEALGKRGERIGALLIVGSDPIVPFHRLPNPTDDNDNEVPSDSPYATLDSNYFVPEWAVGRLPGEGGPDAGLLLEQIRQIQRYHIQHKNSSRLFSLNLFSLFSRLLSKVLPARPVQSFGYTAAVWRRSSLAVFRPIGAPHTVLASPPQQSGSFDGSRITSANLGYYNLHGLEDSPAWYGQRDPQEINMPDYPVALAPEDLHRNGHAPRVVFSEACYGGHVVGKNEKTSLALKFLSMGTLGVVASTCTAYGSVTTPLVAADLLGNRFWQHLKAGYPAGEALLRAKIDMVREMEARQGFLDGEDQKTLISFVLYGDPLAAYDGFRVQAKVAPRPKDHMPVKTVSDRPEEGAPSLTVPPEVFNQVKGLLSEYLPGADLAELKFARQQPDRTDAGGDSPAQAAGPQMKTTRARSNHNGGRLVVTASKQVQVAQHIHRHYVRMTLDEAGKPVKMSISR